MYVRLTCVFIGLCIFAALTFTIQSPPPMFISFCRRPGGRFNSLPLAYLPSYFSLSKHYKYWRFCDTDSWKPIDTFYL